MKVPGMKMAMIGALVFTGISVSACVDDRPGYNSDRHHHRDRDHNGQGRHDRYDRDRSDQ